MMTSGDGLTSPARLLRLASWVIAILFAVFLNMLGSLVIRDMAFAPHGGPPAIEQFADTPAKARLDAARRDLQSQRDALGEKAETMEVARGRAAKEYGDAKESFRNWLATRSVTGDSSRDPDILARTRKLDALQSVAISWQHQIDAIGDQQRALGLKQSQLEAQIADEDAVTERRFNEATRHYELQVFGLRLALTLPILLVAVWLFIRYRKARYWTFVYGFALFALSAFFIELVPYLPNFGGYVRVLVGIVLTVFAGLYMLKAFQRYVERKRLELQQDQGERARAIGYDKAVRSFEKKRCPSCDKQWSLGGDDSTFCVHCGLRLFNLCGCGGRNFSFFPHCHQCGAAQTTGLPAASDADAL
ncbi:zinc ribbon domain-containing protein [Paraburkholderia sediminicola]